MSRALSSNQTNVRTTVIFSANKNTSILLLCIYPLWPLKIQFGPTPTGIQFRAIIVIDK